MYQKISQYEILVQVLGTHIAKKVKALFFDMDDTLCDTQSANQKAVDWLLAELESHGDFDHEVFISQYLSAIYRELDDQLKYLTAPVWEIESFRTGIILEDLQVTWRG